MTANVASVTMEHPYINSDTPYIQWRSQTFTLGGAKPSSITFTIVNPKFNNKSRFYQTLCSYYLRRGQALEKGVMASAWAPPAGGLGAWPPEAERLLAFTGSIFTHKMYLNAIFYLILVLLFKVFWISVTTSVEQSKRVKVKLISLLILSYIWA